MRKLVIIAASYMTGYSLMHAISQWMGTEYALHVHGRILSMETGAILEQNLRS